jgi:acyl-CoA dehydrogenase
MSTTADAEAPEGAEIPTFSLELSQDQRDIRDWVHGFADNVVRPAASEWDEREETPWPIIQEAAKIGLYGFEGMA